MAKNTRWQLFVILLVLAWTLYNIFPTILYYTKPLSRPVHQDEVLKIEQNILERLKEKPQDTIDYLKSFCSLVNVHPVSIVADPNDTTFITLTLKNAEETNLVRKLLPQAGAVIPEKSAQISIIGVDGNTVKIARRPGLTLPSEKEQPFFTFVEKKVNDTASPQYRALVKERFIPIALAASRPTEQSFSNTAAIEFHDKKALLETAQYIVEVSTSLKPVPEIQKRILQYLFTANSPNTSPAALQSTLEQEISLLSSQLSAAEKEKAGDVHSQEQTEKQLERNIDLYKNTVSIVKNVQSQKNENLGPLTAAQIDSSFESSGMDTKKTVFAISLQGRNPLLSAVGIDWKEDSFFIKIDEDVRQFLEEKEGTNEELFQAKQFLHKLLLNEIGAISNATSEFFKEDAGSFFASMSKSSGNGLIVFSLDRLGKEIALFLENERSQCYFPSSIDLSYDALPYFSFSDFAKASPKETQLCFIMGQSSQTETGLKPGSLYVILHGGLKLLERNDGSKEDLQKDIQDLISIMQQKGFLAYSGKIFGQNSPYVNDIIFEQERFYEPFIEATKEAFYVPGSSLHGYLEIGSVKDRLAADNKIDNLYQEELLKWKESYQASQVSLNAGDRFLIPKPPKNIFWSNFKRAWNTFWRGDEDRVLKWGLDLSGGKTVRIQLVDQANTPVTKEQDLKQATSELYSRLNKMGVSERTIRIENDTIVIDFPGVSDMSASDLLKASAMYFHIVNEKFSPYNPELGKQVQAFLQEVWNEALVTNNKDIENIQAIAQKKIDAVRSGAVKDATISALLDEGLILENPCENIPSTSFDDTTSMIARYAGDDPSGWYGQTNPLVIVLKNYALEGSNLENIQATYDASKGNILVFNIRAKDSKNSSLSPKDIFYTWTSQFSQEGIVGTVKENYSRGRGWRMAVILNGSIINAPSLSSSLKDSAMITGNFSQREVQKLASNLQAGSLSFTPKILSEQNVSPELGVKERKQGLTAAVISVLVVIAVMCAYYRFAGLIASIAVLFNILIIWAVMQNIEAAITLPAIAGIVLTVAMAVDANVLVFERIREEFFSSKRIASAIQLGYEKAFSAITDSNLTTIIAAFILTQFDCGPVRGFAITLIIGLISSMFTSLFVTKYYFTRWAENPKHTFLTMANWIKATNFDFLSWKKPAFISTIVLFLIGSACTVMTWKSMLGMDFTGGYALVVEVDAKNGLIPKEIAEKALVSQGVLPSEIQIRELGRPSLLRLQLSSSLEEKDRPFHNLPQSTEETAKYTYQTIPRLDFVVSALEKGGLSIRPVDKATLSQHWTAISGQFSDVMRNNALLALGLSIVAILIYIAVRFEWVYAISAVLALLHDVLLTIAFIAILRMFHVPIQINLEVIGAIMTIIGYSLNDTIIIFDRVREDVGLYKKKSFSQIVNMALNSTLSRTVLTSGITLLVLLCLVLFGGPSIFAFSFVMFLGVFLGTLSSLFIAGPLLVFFHQKEK